MAVEPRNYYTDFLGTFGSEHRDLFASFLNNQGLERTQAQLDYLARDSISLDALHNLDVAIRNVGTDRFVRPDTSYMEIVGKYTSLWSSFQGATIEALCQTYILGNGLVEGRLITNQQMTQQFDSGDYTEIGATASPRGDFRVNGRDHSFPDGLSLVWGKKGIGMNVEKLFEFKSTTTSGEDRNPYSITWAFVDPDSRRVIRRVMADITGVDGRHINLPSRNNLSILKVAASVGISNYPDREITSPYPVEVIGLRRVKGFSMLVLKMMLGKISEQKDWNNIFLPVNANTAETIEDILAIKSSRRPRRNSSY